MLENLGDVSQREWLKRTNWLLREILLALSKGFPSNRDFVWVRVKIEKKIYISRLYEGTLTWF
jgi:hypothetical protein